MGIHRHNPFYKSKINVSSKSNEIICQKLMNVFQTSVTIWSLSHYIAKHSFSQTISKIGLKQTNLFKKLLHRGKHKQQQTRPCIALRCCRGKREGWEDRSRKGRPCRKITLSQRLFPHSLNLLFDHIIKLKLRIFMTDVDDVVKKYILQYVDC